MVLDRRVRSTRRSNATCRARVLVGTIDTALISNGRIIQLIRTINRRLNESRSMVLGRHGLITIVSNAVLNCPVRTITRLLCLLLRVNVPLNGFLIRLNRKRRDLRINVPFVGLTHRNVNYEGPHATLMTIVLRRGRRTRRLRGRRSGPVIMFLRGLWGIIRALGGRSMCSWGSTGKRG